MTETFIGELRRASEFAFPRAFSLNNMPIPTPGGSALAIETGTFAVDFGRTVQDVSFRQVVGVGYFELRIGRRSELEIVARVVRGSELAGVREGVAGGWLVPRMVEFSAQAPRFLPALERQYLAMDVTGDAPPPRLVSVDEDKTWRLIAMLNEGGIR